MRKTRNEMAALAAGLLILALPLMAAPKSKQPAAKSDTPAASDSKTFSSMVVYTEYKSPQNHYIPSGYMGDYNGVKIDLASKDNPQKGMTCVKATFQPSSPSVPKWAGMYWQDPANNWGEQDGGFDLSGATRLTFWARGAKGGEVVKTFKVGGIKGTYSDSDEVSMGPVTLEPTWKQYTIDLKGRDLSHIIGAFAWAADLDTNPNGLTFYLDEIKFE